MDVEAARTRRRGSRTRRGAQVAIGLAAAWQLVRLARVLRRGWEEQRQAEALLRESWVVLPPRGDERALRVHARESIGATSTELPPVVLVHGCGRSGAYFARLAACLSPHAYVLVPDLPGHGRSDRPSRVFDVPELARALAAWMEARGVDSAVLAGHSLGCQVAAEVAVRRPSLVAGLVLLGPTTDQRGRSAQPPGGVLPRVRVPTIVVRGEHDRVAPGRWSAKVARLVHSLPPVVIAGHGHAVHDSAPRDVARHVLALAHGIARGSAVVRGHATV
jgi:pimeloyl-ACP methyl ester carboxylesterase